MYDLANIYKRTSQALAGCFARRDCPIWADSSTTRECQALEEALGGAKAVAEVTGSAAYCRFSGNQVPVHPCSSTASDTCYITYTYTYTSPCGCLLEAVICVKYTHMKNKSTVRVYRFSHEAPMSSAAQRMQNSAFTQPLAPKKKKKKKNAPRGTSRSVLQQYCTAAVLYAKTPSFTQRVPVIVLCT